jgi:DNA gyrase inhibitor GyrI
VNELTVEILELEPMRIAAAHGFGERPEDESWRKLMAFAKDRGLLDDLAGRRVFGFNNPDPTPGSPNYGYDSWLTVGPEVESGEDITMLDFGGGLYAVTHCEGVAAIGSTWKQLVTWRESSEYSHGSHQWLEEVLNPGDFVTSDGNPSPDEEWAQVRFLLYLPIAA